MSEHVSDLCGFGTRLRGSRWAGDLVSTSLRARRSHSGDRQEHRSRSASVAFGRVGMRARGVYRSVPRTRKVPPSVRHESVQERRRARGGACCRELACRMPCAGFLEGRLRPKSDPRSPCSLGTEARLVEHRVQGVLFYLQVERAARDIQVAGDLCQVPLSDENRSADRVPFDPAECGLSRGMRV
jgi:hypothetical protein